MSDIDPTQQPPLRESYQPGMVVNGWQLREDGQWHLYRGEPKPTKPLWRRTWVIVTAVIATMVIVGSMATAGTTAADKGKAVKHPTSLGAGSDTGSADQADAPVANPDAKWGLAFTAAGGIDMIEEVADHSGRAGDAATSYDLETASVESYAAQSAADDILDLIDSLDESEDSPLAQDARGVWQQCSDAYGFSGDVLGSYDLGNLEEATTGLSTCSEGMQGLTARVNGLTE